MCFFVMAPYLFLSFEKLSHTVATACHTVLLALSLSLFLSFSFSLSLSLPLFLSPFFSLLLIFSGNTATSSTIEQASSPQPTPASQHPLSACCSSMCTK